MFVPLGAGFAAGSAVSGKLLAHLAVVWAVPDAQTVLLGIAIDLVGTRRRPGGLTPDRLHPRPGERRRRGVATRAASTVSQFGLGLGFTAVGSWVSALRPLVGRSNTTRPGLVSG